MTDKNSVWEIRNRVLRKLV